MQKIMIIEDDQTIRDELSLILGNEGYSVIPITDFTEITRQIKEYMPDLILLDLGLPGRDGLTLCADIWKISSLPVIIVTSRDSSADEFRGLSLGSDDYITKPFDIKELLARINVQLRNSRKGQKITQNVIQYGGLSLNTGLHEAKFGKKTVKLTKTEFAILKILLSNPKQVVTKSQLLDRIAMDTPDCVESSLKVHISNLRKKLREISDIDFIEAVWGIGFKICDTEEKS